MDVFFGHFCSRIISHVYTCVCIYIMLYIHVHIYIYIHVYIYYIIDIRYILYKVSVCRLFVDCSIYVIYVSMHIMIHDLQQKTDRCWMVELKSLKSSDLRRT